MASNITSGYISAMAFFMVVFLAFYIIGVQEIRDAPRITCSLNPTHKRSWSSTRYCAPKTSIFFLKTHKCASSTVQNILMRFGDTRNLAFALPKDGNYIGHPTPFSASYLTPPFTSRYSFNILCHHLRLDMNEVQSVMPADSTFITILRDPVNLFVSMYDYYNFTGYTGLPLEEFINNRQAMDKLARQRMNERYGRNQMLFDMGFHNETWDNDTMILNAMNIIDNFFDLVMIAERFEESVILMKHQLCWSMQDIVYLVHNKRSSNYSRTFSGNITSRVKAYNRADQLLYEHFLRKLDNAIDKFGRDRMANEINELRLWNSVWHDHCIQKLATSSDDIPEETKAYSSKVYSFILKSSPIASMCTSLAIEELQYTNKLRLKQKF